MALRRTESQGDLSPFPAGDNDSKCAVCAVDFDLFKRRHHCRNCGASVCSECSEHRLPLLAFGPDTFRVCDGCFSTSSAQMGFRIAKAEKSDADKLTKPSHRESVTEDRSAFSPQVPRDSPRLARIYGVSPLFDEAAVFRRPDPSETGTSCASPRQDASSTTPTPPVAELEELVANVMDSRQYLDRLEQIAQSHKVELQSRSNYQSDMQSFGLKAVGLHQKYHEWRRTNETIVRHYMNGMKEKGQTLLKFRATLYKQVTGRVQPRYAII